MEKPIYHTDRKNRRIHESDGKSFFELHSLFKDEARHLVYLLANVAVFNALKKKLKKKQNLKSHFKELSRLSEARKIFFFCLTSARFLHCKRKNCFKTIVVSNFCLLCYVRPWWKPLRLDSQSDRENGPTYAIHFRIALLKVNSHSDWLLKRGYLLVYQGISLM